MPRLVRNKSDKPQLIGTSSRPCSSRRITSIVVVGVMLYRGRRGPVANSDIGRTMDCADPSFTLCEPAEVRNRARAAGSARTPSRGLSQDWGSCRDGCWWMRIVGSLEALPELRGKDLVCWCAPENCHGDVLLDLANKLRLIGCLRALCPFLFTNVGHPIELYSPRASSRQCGRIPGRKGWWVAGPSM